MVGEANGSQQRTDRQADMPQRREGWGGEGEGRGSWVTC